MLTVKNSQTKNIILLCSHLLCCKTSQQLYILVTDLHPLLHFGMIQIAKKSKQLQVSNFIKIRAEKIFKNKLCFQKKSKRCFYYNMLQDYTWGMVETILPHPYSACPVKTYPTSLHCNIQDEQISIKAISEELKSLIVFKCDLTKPTA